MDEETTIGGKRTEENSQESFENAVNSFIHSFFMIAIRHCCCGCGCCCYWCSFYFCLPVNMWLSISDFYINYIETRVQILDIFSYLFFSPVQFTYVSIDQPVINRHFNFSFIGNSFGFFSFSVSFSLSFLIVELCI